jgi:hypothetical protein
LNQYKLQYDCNQHELKFQPSDWAWLRLLHRPIASLNISDCGKLGLKFYDPFHVLQRVGDVTYKLQLPLGANSYVMSSMSACSRSIAAFHWRVRVSCLLFAMGGHAENQQRSPNAALHGVAASSWYARQDRLQRMLLGCHS